MPKLDDSHLLKLVKSHLKPAIDASLDAVAVVNADNRIVYINLMMKNLLEIKGRSLREKPVFCDLIQLAACGKNCEIEKAIKSGRSVRFDETPASRGAERHRIIIKAVPIFDPASPGEKAAVGAVINVRKTTAEILLQAKYHKLIGMVEDKDDEIHQLKEKMKSIMAALRRARIGAIGR